MNDLEKLKRLLHHWQEHNNEHAESYRDWAEKTASLGHKELSGILERLCEETKALSSLFQEARKKIG